MERDKVDALIAEHFFGWRKSEQKHRVADPDGYNIRHLLLPPDADWALEAYQLEPGMNSIKIPIPSYSTDMNEALKVMDIVRGTTFERDSHTDNVTSIAIHFVKSVFGDPIYEIRFYDNNHNTWVSGEFAFIPYGVCILALELVYKKIV